MLFYNFLSFDEICCSSMVYMNHINHNLQDLPLNCARKPQKYTNTFGTPKMGLNALSSVYSDLDVTKSFLKKIIDRQYPTLKPPKNVWPLKNRNFLICFVSELLSALVKRFSVSHMRVFKESALVYTPMKYICFLVCFNCMTFNYQADYPFLLRLPLL